MNRKAKIWIPWAVIVAAMLASVLLVNPAQSSTMKVYLTINGRTMTAMLADSATTRDFVSLLPLTIKMDHLFAREISGDLPRPLAEGGERMRTYQVGEIIYWSPSAHLAIYYHHDGQTIPSPGVIVLGRIEGSTELLRAPGPVSVTIEAIKGRQAAFAPSGSVVSSQSEPEYVGLEGMKAMPEAAITWTRPELEALAASDDLHIAPLREDGVTLGTPTWIWSVVVDGALYVRAYNGKQSRWHKAALRERAGQITGAGMTRDVGFEAVDGAINDRVDDAYRAKYAKSPYLRPMIGARARSATVRVTPRNVAG